MIDILTFITKYKKLRHGGYLHERTVVHSSMLSYSSIDY